MTTPSPHAALRRLPVADGGALVADIWPAAGRPCAQLIVCHGYLEHAGRYGETARALQAAGVEVWAYDQRGHGRSTGRRAHVRRFADYQDDLRAVARAARAAPAGGAAGPPQVWLGHSLGGLIALATAAAAGAAARQGGALGPDGLVLSNPFLRLAPGRRGLMARLGPPVGRLLPHLRVPANIASEALTGDPQEVAAHRADRHVQSHATAGWARAVDGAQRALEGAPLATACPVLWVLGEADPVACVAASAAAFARLEAPDKLLWRRPGERHEVLHEAQRAALIADIVAWVVARNSPR